MPTPLKIDPELDLVLERTVPIKPELIWKAWTTPELLKKWFTPSPWKTVDCTIDLKPGGIFHTTMESPEGHQFPNAGCYLEIIEGKKLVWTSALGPGFRPVPQPENGAGGMAFTGIILLEPEGNGTRYKAIAMHGNSVDKKMHEQMGFHEGWGKVLEQLVAVMSAK